MGKEKYSSFESHEFFGEFFLDEESYEARFPAKLHYSPEKGLAIEYNIADADVRKECNVLVGILDTGEKCTLIGPFDFNRGSHRWGSVVTSYGMHGFSYLLIGEFFKEEQCFERAMFDMQNMQEFFYPQGKINGVPYCDGVLETINGSDWCLELIHRASFKHVGRNFGNIVFSRSDDALKCLQEAFEGVVEKYPSESFYFRETLEFAFNYSCEKGKAARDIYKEISKIAALFSIFMNVPTFPSEVVVYLKDKPKLPVKLLASLRLDSQTVDLVKTNLSHYIMPINARKIDLSKVVPAWLDVYDEYRVLSTTFQYETGFRTLHSAYSDVVLFATNVEAIAGFFSMKGDEKYEGPVNKYGSEELKSSIVGIFEPYSKKSLGKNISDLRNEIAHVGRPKKLINAMGLRDYVGVSEILRLVVVSHLFSQIGVGEDVTFEYQNKLMPDVSGE